MVESPPAPRRGASITGQGETLKVAGGGTRDSEIKELPLSSTSTELLGLALRLTFSCAALWGDQREGVRVGAGGGSPGCPELDPPRPRAISPIRATNWAARLRPNLSVGHFINTEKGNLRIIYAAGASRRKRPGRPQRSSGFSHLADNCCDFRRPVFGFF